MRKRTRTSDALDQHEVERDKVVGLASLLRKDVGSGIIRAFDLMEVAERVIAQYGGKDSEISKRSFRLLAPGDLAGFSDDLYRGHCREILDRLQGGADTRPGTDAELCVAFHNASLAAPLSNSYVLAYEESFESAMRVPASGRGRLYGDRSGQYSWPTEGLEIRGEMRKKLSKDWRVP